MFSSRQRFSAWLALASFITANAVSFAHGGQRCHCAGDHSARESHAAVSGETPADSVDVDACQHCRCDASIQEIFSEGRDASDADVFGQHWPSSASLPCPDGSCPVNCPYCGLSFLSCDLP